jgi:hypothetical protein
VRLGKEEAMDCKDLQDQLDGLRGHVTSLLFKLLTDHSLSAAERKAINLDLVDSRQVIAAVKEELEKCPTALAIVGVECTQAIQYFAINGQGSRYAPDNSVPLSALRTTVLRVYVASEGGLSPGPGVPAALISGVVSVDRLPATGSQVQHLTDLKPINGPIVGRPAGTLDRGEANHTLNFRLAPVDCQGTLRATIRVFEVSDDAHNGGGAHSPNAETQVFCRFTPVPTFRVRGVLIHYTGDGMDLPAPTGLDLARSLEASLQMYPVGSVEFAECIVQDFGLNLATPGAGCGPGWEGPGGLMMVLRDLEAATDDRDIYVGLIPRQARLSVGGCGNTGIAASKVGAGRTLAQEIGHALGRKHAPAGGAPGADQDYPVYGEYPSGSIGEFGFDVFSSKVYDPEFTTDFMGYDSPTWVSPYTFNGIRAAISARFRDERFAAKSGNDNQWETLFLKFRVGRDDSVQLAHSYHLPVAPRPPDPDPFCDIACELLGPDGEVLVFQRCRWRAGHQDPDGPSTSFHEALPWVENTAAIRFLRGGVELHVEAIEPDAPRVEQPTLWLPDITSHDLSHDVPVSRQVAAEEVWSKSEPMTVRWTGSHPDKGITYMLRYSNDGGRNWRAIGVNLWTTSLRLRPSSLAGGTHCLLQVVASSGVRTSVAQSKPFTVPLTPRLASILSPEPRSQVQQRVPVVLRGGAYSPDFGLGDMQEAAWTSSRDGELGHGFELVADRLSVGLHTLTLTVPDGTGAMVTVSASLQVLPNAEST